MAPVWQLLSAIELLYADQDQGRQKGANSWLDEFSKTNEAWEAALLLLDNGKTEVQFFCANMLLSKVLSSPRRSSAVLPAGVARQNLDITHVTHI